MDATVGHTHAQFAKPAKQVFLHLPRHARLLGTLATWRMRVGVCGEGAVEFRRLVRADAGVDFEVVVKQATHDLGRFVALHRGLGDLKRCQTQLGDHVPVNRAQAFVPEEGS